MSRVAKVVLPITLDKEFDYCLDAGLGVKRGARVLVDFKGKKRVGIVRAISKISKFKNLKSIISCLDREPCLNNEHFKLSRQLSEVYPYPQGEFLFMILPVYLRKSKKLKLKKQTQIRPKNKALISLSQKPLINFIKANTFSARYQLWRIKLKEALKDGSVAVCFPQRSYLLEAKKILEKDFPGEVSIIHSQMSQKDFSIAWEKSRANCLILGTRVSLFYYPSDLRLIVLEEENSPYYFQEGKPFYHLREVAMILARLRNCDLILSGDFPSLAVYKLISEKKILLEDTSSEPKKIKIVSAAEFSKKQLINPVLRELLRKILQENKTGLILWNKKGFARFLRCSNCSYALSCEHCSALLQFSKETKQGSCPYCQRKLNLPPICPKCNSGYFRARGYGIERLQDLLKRIFPEARIDNWSNHSPNSQFVLSTSKILSYLYGSQTFDQAFILDIDSWLSGSDYQATFDAFLYLNKVTFFLKDSLYVFTANPNHYLFQNINDSWRHYYQCELETRKKLNLPPFGLIAKITLRAKNENRLLKQAEYLYNKFKMHNQDVYGPFKEQPFKLRDKFRYSLIIKAKRNLVSRKIIKEEIRALGLSSVKLAVSLQ